MAATAAEQPEPEPENEGGDGDNALQVATPLMECRCGAVPMSEIETVLLDPRNSSYSFWRHRHADTIITAHVDVKIEAPAESAKLPPGWSAETDSLSGQQFWVNNSTGEIMVDGPPSSLEWSREAELLGRRFTPANLYETAQLRVILAVNSALADKMQEVEAAKNEKLDKDQVALAELHLAVMTELDRGCTLRCPSCGVRAQKDGACVHMDSCPCGSHWCFLCGKLERDCPRGGGGCDEDGIYLHNLPGWSGFALDGEEDGIGANQEYYRRRQAFMVRAVTVKTDPDLWAKLRETYPDLLNDTPTRGRSIDWDSLPSAEWPLFGKNKSEPLQAANGEMEFDAAAQRRMEQHWEQVRLEDQLLQMRAAQRERHQKCCIPTLAILGAALIVGTSVLMDLARPPSPAHLIEVSAELHLAPEPEPEPEPVPEPEPEPVPELSNGTNNTNGTNHTNGSNSTGGATYDTLTDLQVDFGDAFELDVLALGPKITLALAILLWLIAVISRQRSNVLNVNTRVSAGTWFAACLNLVHFWPVLYSKTAILDLGGFAAYFLFPVCGVIEVGLVQLLFDFATVGRNCDDCDCDGDGRDTIRGCSCCIAIATGVVYLIFNIRVRSRLDDEYEEEYEEAEVEDLGFECGPICKTLTWIPLIEFVLGVCGMIGFLIAWLKSGAIDPNRREMAAWLMASFCAASLLYWPASMQGSDLIEAPWLIAHIAIPLCSMLGLTGASMQLFLCIGTVLDREIDEDDVIVPTVLVAFVVFVWTEIAMALTRSPDWEMPEASDATFECDDFACQYLTQSPRVFLGVGGALWWISVILTICGRGDENGVPLAGMVFFSPCVWWPMWMGAEAFVTTSWAIAYCTAGVSTFMAGIWVFVALLVFIDCLSDGEIDIEIGLKTATVAGLASLAHIITTVASMAALRDSVESGSGPAEIEFEYSCTWPCVALRITWAVIVGCMAISIAVVTVPKLGLIDCRRYTYSCRTPEWWAMVLSYGGGSLVALALLCGATVEAATGWPIEMPVEGLVTASAGAMYTIVPISTALFSSGTWSALLFNLGARARMLSTTYDMGYTVVLVSLFGSAWCLFVLRHSVNSGDDWHLSTRSRTIAWQALGFPFVGLSAMVHCWNFSRGHARRQLPWITLRTLFLWVPAGVWPLVALARSTDSIDAIDGIFAKAPILFVLLALSAAGFTLEVCKAACWFDWYRGCTETRGAVASAIVFLGVLVANYEGLVEPEECDVQVFYAWCPDLPWTSTSTIISGSAST